MNRVKHISRKYEEQRPFIDRDRAIRSQTRRTRKAAEKVRQQRAEFDARNRRQWLEAKTVPMLREMAKAKGVPLHSRLRKADLVRALMNR